MKEEINKIFAHKKVLILGMGREGTSTLNFLKKYIPEVEIDTTDQKDGENYLDKLNEYDLIIKSPGIPWTIPEIVKAKKMGKTFLSQTEIFLTIFRDNTIGITGTKGKSTTASLIYNILKISGINVELVGNIGNPVLDYVDELSETKTFIYEMSSHQLSDITTSPHIAVFLNVYPEHLDYYQTFEDYFQAKANISKFQNENDYFIYNSDFEDISSLASKVKSKKVSFSAKQEIGISLIKNPLLGEHNKSNICAAIAVAKSLGISEENIKEGIESFRPLEERLEIIGEYNGVKFIDDGLATIPQATIAAINSYKNNSLVLILGGFDRGVNFDILGKEISREENIKGVVLIGQTADKIQKVLLSHQFSGEIVNMGNAPMQEIVSKAFHMSKPGYVVLLSPAATSFDMFKDYKDRGNQFKEAVSNLKS